MMAISISRSGRYHRSIINTMDVFSRRFVEREDGCGVNCNRGNLFVLFKFTPELSY